MSQTDPYATDYGSPINTEYSKNAPPAYEPQPQPPAYVDNPEQDPYATPRGRRGKRGRRGDNEMGNVDGMTSINDAVMQAAFLRRVYSLLSVQLLITFGVICLFIYCHPVKEYIQSGNSGSIALYWSAFGVFLVSYIMLVCVKSLRRKHPYNLMLLLIFTLAMSYLVGVMSSFYNTELVLIAVGMTVGVTVAVSLFACQTKLPFTPIAIAMLVIVTMMLLFAITAIFTYTRILLTVYAALAATLFALFLLVDTYLILQGSKHGSLFLEEYIFAVIILYVDVVTIFTYILCCLGGAARN